MLQAEAKDGHSLGVYCAKPYGEIKGGVVVIQEIFGVNAHIKKVCHKFAKEGYIAVAPALFDRISPNIELTYFEDDINKGFKLKEMLRWDSVLEDVEAAANLVKSMADVKLAVVGYCYGGSVAWRASTRLDNFQSSICYYGAQIAEFADEKPRCPVMLHFGSKDIYIKPEHILAISAKRPEVTIHIYEADHGFNCGDRGNYNATCADLAFSRSIEFIANPILNPSYIGK